MTRPITTRLLALASILAAAAVAAAIAGTPSRAASISQLNSQLSHERARQQSLAGSVGRLSALIGALDRQITLVESREAAVQADLDRDRAALLRTRGQVEREQQLIVLLKGRLARARMILSRQLVSSYEGQTPDLVSVVLEAHGFSDLLNQLDFLRRAEQQQQALITATRQAKLEADAAEHRLARLEATEQQQTEETQTRVDALAGMNELLHSKQAALASARAAQQAELEASRAKGRQLQQALSKAQAAQAAAEAAARDAIPTSTGPALGPSGGWAIPYAIVLCESGGQNLTPNSAGASGYYQIMPATWKLFDGTGPAAYLASKAEQDAVATRIWNGGAGASNWVCAGIVGIH